jgi:hypothetical protein
MLLLPHQRPLADHGIIVKVHCSASCDVSVRAKVAIQHETPFTDYSRFIYIRARTTATVKILFSLAQQGRLVAGIGRHRRATATVTTALVDPSGNIERQSATITLPLAS